MFYVGLTGIVDSVYLRISFQSVDRLNASGLIFSSNEELLNDLEVLVCYNSCNNINSMLYIMYARHCRYLSPYRKQCLECILWTAEQLAGNIAGA